MEQRSHDSPSGEIVAALWHLGFAAAYMCALLFHLKERRDRYFIHRWVRRGLREYNLTF